MSSSEMVMKIFSYLMLISLISARPFHPPRSHPRAGNHPHGAKIPLYMMHLYHTLMGNNKEDNKPEKQILEESDTVQSLTAKDFIVEDNRWSVTFDLSTVPRNDELRMVKLQVHLPPFTKSGNVTVDIYHANRGGNKLFLGSVMTSISNNMDSSWATFNVTEMIQKSLLEEEKLTNHGDVKSVDMSHHKHSRKIKKRDVSLHEISTDQAIIVLFIKHKPFSQPKTSSFIKKLAVNTMKMIAFRRHMRARNDIQTDTPINVYPMTEEEHRPSQRQVDRMVDSKDVLPKYGLHSSGKGPVLLY
ncbi:nodal homolog 3-A-like [Dendropsophus ebraccatus]|uniref:nodal homolog 3-A-like n=1 Tax=Dendropsophus ebraccatus TaxID=150705 RepID=UPI003831A41C